MREELDTVMDNCRQVWANAGPDYWMDLMRVGLPGKYLRYYPEDQSTWYMMERDQWGEVCWMRTLTTDELVALVLDQ